MIVRINGKEKHLVIPWAPLNSGEIRETGHLDSALRDDPGICSMESMI